MQILLITSEKDVASKKFKEILLNNYDFIKQKENLYFLNSFKKQEEIDNITLFQENKTNNKIFLKTIDNLHLFSNDKEILNNNNYDIVVFLSKHSTSSEIKPKCFTVHAVGNFSKAKFGGLDKTLVKTDGILIRFLLINLKKNKPNNLKKYEVKQEATHHGPYLSTPVIFYEIGSSNDDWNNTLAVSYMSKILIYSLINYSQQKLKDVFGWECVCGFGGSHYCTVFNRYSFNINNKFSFGHIVPSYAMNDFVNNNLSEEIKKKGFSKKILKENMKEL
jgi:D-aminoacyl-tRNA deacylase